jgi:hypothetical protein
MAGDDSPGSKVLTHFIAPLVVAVAAALIIAWLTGSPPFDKEQAGSKRWKRKF